MSTISGSATEIVQGPQPTTITSVTVSLAAGTIGPGGSDTATARLNGGNVTSLPAGATIDWISSNTAVATVLAGGSSTNPLQTPVTAVDGGVATGQEVSVTITATVTQ